MINSFNQTNEIIEQINIFEKSMSHKYPLANDFFTIDHGNNYFNFFNKLGSVNYYYQKEKNTNNVNATACSVLRTFNGLGPQSNSIKAWYICDLKVDPKARGGGFSYNCLIKGLIPSYFKSNKCFAICMQPNVPVEKLSKNLYWPKIKATSSINIYLLEYLDLINYLKDIINYFESGIEFESNMGVKDIILESTREPLDVLHIKKATSLTNLTDNQISIPDPKYKFFLTLINNQQYNQINNKLKSKLFGSALIYSYNMDNFDWKLISSADI